MLNKLDSDGDVNLNTFKLFKVIFDMYMVMLGNYTLLGLAIWQGKKSVYYITFHPLDRMS